jgi:hypothetical protein
MANEQNLRPSAYKLSEEEAKKGGRRSGEVRREKRKFREMFETFLESDFKGDKELPKSKRRKNKEIMMMRMVKQAMNGDLNSQKYIIEMIGEAPAKQVEVTAKVGTIEDDRTIEEIEKEIERLRLLDGDE